MKAKELAERLMKDPEREVWIDVLGYEDIQEVKMTTEKTWGENDEIINVEVFIIIPRG